MRFLKQHIKISIIALFILLAALFVSSAGVTFKDGGLKLGNSLVMESGVAVFPNTPTDGYNAISSSGGNKDLRIDGERNIELVIDEQSKYPSEAGLNVYVDSPSGTPLFTVKRNGNVGIGTNPTEKLTISGNSASIAIRTASAPDTYLLRLYANHDYTKAIQIFGAGSTELIRHYYATPGGLILMPNGGNVGIGINTPTQKLSVAGIIESTQGGFKFPDGTVQTTAATATQQAAVATAVEATAPTTVPTNTFETLTATALDAGNLDVTGEATIGGVSSDGVGKVVCVKEDKTLGTCSSAILEDGTCTCA